MNYFFYKRGQFINTFFYFGNVNVHFSICFDQGISTFMAKNTFFHSFTIFDVWLGFVFVANLLLLSFLVFFVNLFLSSSSSSFVFRFFLAISFVFLSIFYFRLSFFVNLFRFSIYLLLSFLVFFVNLFRFSSSSSFVFSFFVNLFRFSSSSSFVFSFFLSISFVFLSIFFFRFSFFCQSLSIQNVHPSPSSIRRGERSPKVSGPIFIKGINSSTTTSDARYKLTKNTRPFYSISSWTILNKRNKQFTSSASYKLTWNLSHS